MVKLKIIQVTRRSDGELVTINETDFDSSQHQKISASGRAKKAVQSLAETGDTRTDAQKQIDADAIRAENEAKPEPLAETPQKTLEEIEAELNQLMDDETWRAIATLAEEQGIEKQPEQTYRDLIPLIAAKLHEAQTNE